MGEEGLMLRNGDIFHLLAVFFLSNSGTHADAL